MKLENHQGISLVEVLIATGIGAAMLVWLNSMIGSGQKASTEMERLAYAATDSTAVSQQIKRYLGRGRGRALTDVGVTQVGAAAAGFLINRSGAFIFNADLRACEANGFDPSTSATNLSRVVLLCCDQNMALNANLPGGAGTLSLNSACTNSRGLSIQEYQGTVQGYSTCRPHITEMYLRQLGTIPMGTTRPWPLSRLIYGFDFTARTQTFRDGRIAEAGQRLNFSVAGSLSNDLDAFSVACYR
ncbi:hypothetical protein EBQ90_04965 [bacterium]|nr:hypothetical protein [bacterium]